MSLALELLQRHEGPLVWGVNDCVQFAADAVLHYGGWRPELPKYTSEREALEVISKGGGLAALAARALPAPIHVKDAQIGDVVLTAFRDTGPMLGVADPGGFWVRFMSGGFVPLPLDKAIAVWPCRR